MSYHMLTFTESAVFGDQDVSALGCSAGTCRSASRVSSLEFVRVGVLAATLCRAPIQLALSELSAGVALGSVCAPALRAKASEVGLARVGARTIGDGCGHL